MESSQSVTNCHRLKLGGGARHAQLAASAYDYGSMSDLKPPVLNPLARVLGQHVAEVKRIVASNGATNVRVVGSVARGEERPGSDIDLLVDFLPGRSLFDQAQLMADLKALLGVSVDVVSARGLKPKVRDRLLLDARPL